MYFSGPHSNYTSKHVLLQSTLSCTHSKTTTLPAGVPISPYGVVLCPDSSAASRNRAPPVTNTKK